MTTIPKPYGPEDERFVYVVTAVGVEVLQQSALAADSETRPAPKQTRGQRRTVPLAGAHD